jgi:hypothetical protein
MTTDTDAQPVSLIPFTGVKGRLLSRLLQLGFVRFHRVQLGFVEAPRQYQQFLADVVAPRLDALPGRLGVFGAGEHTRVLLSTLPELDARVHCLIDNNPQLWKTRRLGHLVLPPAEAIQVCDVIFLSTAVFQHVIRAELKQKNFRGPIVAVDDVVPPSWFLAA